MSDTVGKGFFQNILTVFSGTVIAQLLSIIGMIAIVRLYEPSQIGSYNRVISFLSLFLIFGTLKYDLAYLVAEGKEKKSIFTLIMMLALGSSVLVLLVFILLYLLYPDSQLYSQLFSNSILVYLYLFLNPILVLFYTVLTSRMRYLTLSILKISLAVILVLVQIAMGFVGFGLNGLLFGNVISLLLIVGICGSYLFIKSSETDFSFRISDVLNVSAKYKNYAIFGVPPDFLASLVSLIPIQLIGSRFGDDKVAYYALSLRVLYGPISLISNSFLEVYKGRASKEYLETGKCIATFNYTLRFLFLLSIIPFVLLFFFAPFMFKTFFGSEWVVAGEYSRILTPMFFVRFIVSPLSYTIYIVQKQKIDFVAQVFILVAVLFSFFIMPDVSSCLALYSLSSFILYIMYLLYCKKAAGSSKQLER